MIFDKKSAVGFPVVWRKFDQYLQNLMALDHLLMGIAKKTIKASFSSGNWPQQCPINVAFCNQRKRSG